MIEDVLTLLDGFYAGHEEVELRRMNDEPAESPWFGEALLCTALFRRPGRS